MSLLSCRFRGLGSRAGLHSHTSSRFEEQNRKAGRNSVSLQFVWSLCERLENFRSDVFVEMEAPSQGRSIALAPQDCIPSGRSLCEQLEN